MTEPGRPSSVRVPRAAPLAGGRVVMLSELYRPELTSTGYYVSRIAERLAAAHEVHAICAQPAYAARGTRAARRETLHDVQVRRVRSTTFDKNRLPLRTVNVLTAMAGLGWRALRGVRRGDIVVAVTNPPTLPLLAAAVCRVRRARLVVLVHDRYPEVLVATGLRRHDARSVKLLGRLNMGALRRAERVVVIGRDAHEALAAALGERVVTITNWAEDNAVVPLAATESALRRELGLVQQQVVLYAGNFGRANDLATLLAAAELLRDSGIRFVLIGDGQRKPWVHQQIAERGLTHVQLAGPYPRTSQSELLAVGDIVVVPSIAGMCGVAVPSRLYNALAAGKPVLAGAEPAAEIARVVAEEHVGWVVPPADATALAMAIEAALADPERAAMAHRCRALATGRYAEQRVLQQWADLIDGLVGPGTPNGEPAAPAAPAAPAITVAANGATA